MIRRPSSGNNRQSCLTLQFGTGVTTRIGLSDVYAGGELVVKKSAMDTIVEVDGTGNATGTTFSGDTFVASHLVNKRLASLCRRICNTLGRSQATVLAKNFQSEAAMEIVRGLHAIAETYDCNSPEMVQFERNLSELVYRVLTD